MADNKWDDVILKSILAGTVPWLSLFKGKPLSYPYGWWKQLQSTPSSTEPPLTVDDLVGQLTQEQQLYFSWLTNQLANEFISGATGNIGDPNKSNSAAYKLLEKTLGDLLSGAPLTSLFGYADFLTDYSTAYPQNPALEGTLVAGGQILMTPDGRYVDPDTGTQYDTNEALLIIKNFLNKISDSGGEQGLTPYEEASLDLALKNLEWEKYQFGNLSADQKASIDLARAQLQQTRNEWLAELKANPTDWIEKWYAESLPTGTQLGETYPWGAPTVGTEAWAKAKGLTEEEAANMGINYPVTSSGGYTSPTYGTTTPPDTSGASRTINPNAYTAPPSNYVEPTGEGRWIPNEAGAREANPYSVGTGRYVYPPSGGNAWQPFVGMSTPLGESMPGTGLNYSTLLGVNQDGLFYNRETGEVFPVDPGTGRQVKWYDPTTDTHGSFIANEQGIPYGTYEYGAPSLTGNAYQGMTNSSPWAIQNVTSKAGGYTQPAITGWNMQTNNPYTWFGVPGYYSPGSGSTAGKSAGGKASESALAKVAAAQAAREKAAASIKSKSSGKSGGGSGSGYSSYAGASF
jgi:hypothetical protein